MCRSLLILICLVCSVCVSAQTRTGIAYYDIDHLYDTVPALFYNDGDHTPAGKLHWTAERYDRKINAIAAVLDSMRMPLVALYGVETEQVVRDLSVVCTGDYSYVHRTLNSLDGMDFALLYYGDIFNPLYIEPGRRYLYIEGTLRQTPRPIYGRPQQASHIDTVGLLLVSDTRMAKWLTHDLREERSRNVKLLVMGRSSSVKPAAAGLYDALQYPESQGRGNVRSRAGWQMRDRILIDTALTVSGGDVYARRWLFDERTGAPRATYDRTRYTGGASYALPVFVYLVR